MISSALIKAQALALGFSRVGLTPAQPAPRVGAYLDWVAAGRHGEMHYLARPDRLARRRDPQVILPGAQTLVMVAVDYGPAEREPHKAEGRTAAYALGEDYHTGLLIRLEALAHWLEQESPNAIRQRAYVDTGAVLERSHAQQAGLGFIGKNTLLIHPRRGSDFLLGEILTEAEVDAYDQPGRETQCGTCTRCLAACPTQAFVAPYVLDARRCISYLTIEHPGWLDRKLRPLMGQWVFGCDVCRAVCPWQKFSPGADLTAWSELKPRSLGPASLSWWLNLDQAAFDQAFRGTAMYRTGHTRLLRNACVAAGNSRDPELAPALKARLEDASPLVRGHAAWALGQVAGQAAVPWLAARLTVELDDDVRSELAACLRDAETAN
jgi:epoxyqueuosine reductase